MKRTTTHTIAVGLFSAFLFWPGIASPATQCLSTTPHRSVDEATMAGLKRYKTFKATQGAASGVKGFLNAVFSFGVSQKISKQVQEKALEASNHLKWTGQKGGLIEILMQSPIAADIPAELLSVTFIGGGDCPYNVLTENLSKDQMGPGARNGYKIDNDASFYTWVSLEKGVTPKVTTVAPGSRGLIVDKVIGDKAAKAALTSSASAREIDQLRSLVREIERVETSAKVTKEVRETLKKREDIKASIWAVEQSLQQALKEQTSAAQAMAWIDSLDQALTFAKLVSQVSSLANSAPKSTIDAIKKAKTKEELKSALADYQVMTLDTVTSYQKDKAIIQERLVLYRKTITDTAKKNGAPESALQLPTTP